MECSQCGRSPTVTHLLCGFGLQGLGGQRLAPEPPVTAPLSQQVLDKRTGSGTRLLFPASQKSPPLIH